MNNLFREPAAMLLVVCIRDDGKRLTAKALRSGICSAKILWEEFIKGSRKALYNTF